MSPLVREPASVLDTYKPFSPDIAAAAKADLDAPYAEVRLTPEDGRYGKKLGVLRPYLSEAALARFRVIIETEDFHMLVNNVLPPELLQGKEELVVAIAGAMVAIADDMPLEMANRITEIEAKSRHDVIAMITALRERIMQHLNEHHSGMMSAHDDRYVQTLLSYIHVPKTSEDVTSPAHTLMLLNALRNVLQPAMNTLLEACRAKATDFDTVEDPKAPGTSLGVRYRGYADRLEEKGRGVFQPDYLTVKFAGATGTHAALKEIAREGADPLQIAATFVQSIVPDAHYLPVTAQINPHDDLSLWCGKVASFCEEMRVICVEVWKDSGRDVVLDGKLQKLLSVKPDEEQSGSSAMPQKVQVINIENAEGTASVLMGTAEGMQRNLNRNRLQRALPDSRMIRELMGDMLPKLLQMLQNMATDLPKLTVNDACRTSAGSLKQTRTVSPTPNGMYSKASLSGTLRSFEAALQSKAEQYADQPILARTHNQPASPTTFGKELAVFAARFRNLNGVLNGSIDGRAISTHFSAAEVLPTATGVVAQLLEDLHTYVEERNGLVRVDEHLLYLPSAAGAMFDAPRALLECIDSIIMSPAAALGELDAHYESLGEALQTRLRVEGVAGAYEIVKKFARGAQMDQAQYRQMVAAILESNEAAGKVSAKSSERLLHLTPESFTGEAGRLARYYSTQQ